MSDSGDNYVYTTVDEEILDENDFIKVAPTEDGDFMEFDKEDNDTIMFSTVQAQYPNATGLKYKGASGAWRAIRAVDNVLNAPKGGWGNRVYCISANESAKQPSKPESTRKRSADAGTTDEGTEHKRTKSVRTDPLLKDLPVTGLSYDTTVEELREYFETNYGDLELCEIKVDRSSGKSRGFGFIRFKDRESAKDCCNGEHQLGGRSIHVKIKVERQMKLFIGGLHRDTKKEELEEYFSEFGELADVYLPQPFRNFAFITFASTEDGRKAVNQKKHDMNGQSVNVEERKNQGQGDFNNSRRDRYDDNSRDRDHGSRGNDRTNRNSSSRSSRDGGGYNNYSSNPPPRDAPRGQAEDPLRALLMQYLTAGH